MIVGLALVVLALVMRSASVNRHVRGRLATSAFAFAAYAVIAAARNELQLSPSLQEQLGFAQPLLLSFGLITAITALLINPWRIDRLPDRFPTIVQDTIVIALFAIAATLILQDKIFATTAVGAVVIGFALQDTLGNLFAGLAVQIEKPFRVGQWVNIAGKDGMVTEVTWRATKIRTKMGNFVIVPNSALARDTITNYSEPTDETRIEVEIAASYDAAPNDVKNVILEAIKDEPLILKTHPPEVLLTDFSESSMTYRVRAWTREFALDEIIRDHIRSAVYYAFRRAGIVIPFPMQVQLFKEDVVARVLDPVAAGAALASVSIFSALSDEQRAELARITRVGLYAAHEIVVRGGEPGSSMFIVARGAVSVTLEAGGVEVARLGPGTFFGEMSLLTGEPRSATVAAVTDSELLEITAESFRRFVLDNPAVVDQITAKVAARSAELHERRVSDAAAAVAMETSQTFLGRVRRFLRVGVN
jgi:small-conductance mechanosensitive channel/CRP-like cAMP-binding protein